MKIKSLLIMPGKEVQKVKIPANIKFIKSLCGNDTWLQTIHQFGYFCPGGIKSEIRFYNSRT